MSDQSTDILTALSASVKDIYMADGMKIYASGRGWFIITPDRTHWLCRDLILRNDIALEKHFFQHRQDDIPCFATLLDALTAYRAALETCTPLKTVSAEDDEKEAPCST